VFCLRASKRSLKPISEIGARVFFQLFLKSIRFLRLDGNLVNNLSRSSAEIEMADYRFRADQRAGNSN
jgi:hypothetical protein